MNARPLKIGDLARGSDTKVVTIRYYEKIGLLPRPERGAGNYREYRAADLDRLRFIRRGRALGFSLDELRALLALASDSAQSCEAVDRMAAAHLANVEQKIADLTRLAEELRRISASCEGGGAISDCRVIEAMAPG